MTAPAFAEKRKQLVESMLSYGSLRSPALKKAFLNVPREEFFPENMKEFSYSDSAFPIGFGQTISQPSTIAAMLEMLGVEKGQRVLEIGAGSGYVIALLCELVGAKGRVFGSEILGELHGRATKTLASLGYKNFTLQYSDGTLGHKEEAPFDRILISAACSQVPKPLVQQLKEKGRLVAPVGGAFTQELILIQKEKGKGAEKARQGYFAFVPLKGKHGF